MCAISTSVVKQRIYSVKCQTDGPLKMLSAVYAAPLYGAFELKLKVYQSWRWPWRYSRVEGIPAGINVSGAPQPPLPPGLLPRRAARIARAWLP